MNRAQETWGAPDQCVSMHSGNPRGRGETEGRRKNIVKTTMAGMFQNMTEDMNPDSQEAQQTPGRINAKRSTPRHVIIKLLEVNDKEKTLKAGREKQLVTYRRKFLIRNHQSQRGAA